MNAVKLIGMMDSARRSFPDLHLVAVLDLRARLVLASCGATRHRQEGLDQLSAEACELLRKAPTGLSGAARPAQALSIAGADLRIFLASPSNPSDGICLCSSAPETLGALISTGRQILASLGPQHGSA